MENKLFEMLKKSAESDIAKAELTLSLLGEHGVGVGEHSTKDFYNNAEEALLMLDNAESRLKTLKKFVLED